MTISSTVSRWEYDGDAATTVFTYTNKIFADTDLEVYSDNVLQTLATQYTVSGVGVETGGAITYLTAPANGVKVVIIRVVADTQETKYPVGGSLPSGVIEDDIDRRTILSQQKEEKLSRAILTPSGEEQMDMTLPVIATRASKYLGFDSGGQPVELDAPAGTTTASTFGAKVILAADYAAAQDLLNIAASVTTAGTLTAYTLVSNETIVGYDDGAVFGIDFHVTCGAAPTIDIDGQGVKALVWPNGTALAAGDVVTGQKALMAYDGTDMVVLSAGGSAASRDTGTADGNVPVMDATGYPAADGSQITNIAPPRGHIDGLILSNNTTDAAKDIDIAAGEAVDDGGAVNMILASTLIKRLDASWAVGTNQGGLDGTESVTGTPDASTWYHAWLIRRSDTGVVDVLFSESATAPTMPTNYDQKRRIGAVLFDATPDILAFKQYGKRFYWTVAPMDINVSTTTSVSRTLYAISTPLGIQCLAIGRLTTNAGSTGSLLLITSPDETDGAASISAAPGATALVSTSGEGAGNVEVFTDTSSQIGGRSNDTTVDIKWATMGWVDPRGRDA